MRLQTIWKTSKKGVDKYKQAWYNMYIKRKRGTKPWEN